MTLRNKATTIVLAAITLSLAANTANATDYRHVDRMALRIVKKSEALFREFRFHYRHVSEFCHLMDDVKELRRHALHVREVARHRGSLAHLASDVREMDRLFHHLENVVARVEHNADHDYHSGHIHGNTAHVAALMHAIENDLHHLAAHVGPATPRRSGYRRGDYYPSMPGPAFGLPVPSRPVRVVPSVPSRHCRYRGIEPSRSTSIPTPFGRLTIHH